jgi:hypothetical protein
VVSVDRAGRNRAMEVGTAAPRFLQHRVFDFVSCGR